MINYTTKIIRSDEENISFSKQYPRLLILSRNILVKT